MSEVNNENKTELTEEQKATLDGGRQAPAATQKPTKEELDEEHKDPNEGKEPDKKTDPKPEDKKDKPEENPEDNKWKDEYVKIDHPSANAAINLLKEAKVSPVEANDIFAEALKTNDLSKVDWARVEKLLGPDKAVLFKAGVEHFYAEKYSVTANTVKEGHELFGGEEGWDKARKHFQSLEKKDPAVKAKLDGIRKALDLGGYAASIALKDLKSMYDSDPNTKGIQNGKHEQGSKPAPTTGEGFTKQQYYEQLDKANREGWSTDKIAELAEKRKIGMLKGI